MVMKAIAVAVAIVGATAGVRAQDPQAVMNDLLRKGVEEGNLRHQNHMMRLEAEREELLRQRQAPDFARFGDPNADSSVRGPQATLPPPRRGRPPRPTVECITFGD